ncbi:metabolite traffic protein EboE [Roseibacillus persicicus]|uniref:metabolite traffic protein EboE n=1 Tax=Roseibacillus persicicus TaxID=454148 RepID=UPI001675C7E9|nr:metabolite traffic protein EboE [Roseibacillus persicicus]
MRFDQHHLAYCTNIHPAESWADTFHVLESDVLAVRDQLQEKGVIEGPFSIGLRLSARAAKELLEGGGLADFASWLGKTQTYVFTINGFPYGDFHGTRVKEKVYQPDWTTVERLNYTKQLFDIIAVLAPEDCGGSVSTLPGSFKEFGADEGVIFRHLEECAVYIDALAQKSGKDLHLGLEPEPLGHFENTAETLAFFERFLATVNDVDLVKRRIGLNYDCCHFALEFDQCRPSLEAFDKAGIRISKVHLSSALTFDPNDADSLESLKRFDEPTYLHQVIVSGKDGLKRVRDLPEFYQNLESGEWTLDGQDQARCHFHVPLYSEAAAPLGTTQSHAVDMLAYRREHPDFCNHFEIETYTWGVLPDGLQSDLTSQIVREFQWVLNTVSSQ